MPNIPCSFEAVILENRPVGAYFRLRFEDASGVLRGALPGQFVSLKVLPGAAPLLRRPFSIARLMPGKGKAWRAEVLYAVVKEGTRLLSRKKPGETLGVLGPLGRSFPYMDKKHPSILVGGGIGLAPLVFLAEHLHRKKVPFTVFLGARTAADLVDLQVFKSLKVPTFLSTDDGSAGKKGFVTGLLEAHLAQGRVPGGTIIQACGPRPMFRELAKVAFNFGIPAYLSWEERMACGMGICLTCTCPVSHGEEIRMVRTCVEGPVFESSRIRWDKVED